MAHPLFERQPLLGRLFDIEIASGGDSVTVNVGHYRPGDPHRPFASTHAAGYRAIYDLARPRPLELRRRHRPVRQSALAPLPGSDRPVGQRSGRSDRSRCASVSARRDRRIAATSPPRPGRLLSAGCDAAFGRIGRLLACSDGRARKFASDAIKNLQHPVDKRHRSRFSCNLSYPAGVPRRIAPGSSGVHGSGGGSTACQKTARLVRRVRSAGAARPTPAPVRPSDAFFSSALVSSGLILPPVVPSNVQFSLGGKPSRSAVESQER